jgi:hypothetical protein
MLDLLLAWTTTTSNVAERRVGALLTDAVGYDTISDRGWRPLMKAMRARLDRNW